MRILIAPDKFKDALSAREAAEALAVGARAARPGLDLDLCPLADGGEGTGPLLAEALGAEERHTPALDPLERPRPARWWWDAPRRRAIIEMAEASGLWLLRPQERDATRTTTFGTGQLMRAALEAGADEIFLAVGGSATVDGGAGCLQALGWTLVDQDGRPISQPASGGMLDRIAHVRMPSDWTNARLTILADVTNPLLGPDGAAAVYGPQKGASPAQVQQLERNLAHWADLLRAARPQLTGSRPPVEPPDPWRQGGASGGLPFGLSCVMPARAISGFEGLAAEVKLRDRMAACDVCFTGEGSLDQQTSAGKVVGGVARVGSELDKPVLAFAGRACPAPGQTLARMARSLRLRAIVVITPPQMPLDAALAASADNLRAAAHDVVAGSAWAACDIDERA